jgi:predicted dehydrogenase
VTVGIIGCGAVTESMYARAVLGDPLLQVSWVSDLDPSRAAIVARAVGAKACPSEELIAQADAIVIATPPASHEALIGACLAPGKTILCEKPFVTTAAAAERLTSAAAELGAALCVGHFRRLYPQVALARQIVSLGVIGAIRELSLSEGGRFTWDANSGYTMNERTGGVLWDTGSHTLDMALYAAALDEQPMSGVSVSAVERDKAEPSHDYGATAAFDADGGRITCRVHFSRTQALPNLVRIVGDRGSVMFVAGFDDRVRLSTGTGTMVIPAETEFTNLDECFSRQLHEILVDRDGHTFAGARFVGQVAVLEALSDEVGDGR